MVKERNAETKVNVFTNPAVENGITGGQRPVPCRDNFKHRPSTQEPQCMTTIGYFLTAGSSN